LRREEGFDKVYSEKFYAEMKEGFDKEIDSLLRRRARGTAAVREHVDGARARGAVTHLDADELGAFAEGALPVAARVAAATHLADCDECRGVVVGLARVSGVTAESKKLAAVGTVPNVVSAGPASWRAWAASLFAPRMMRYAAPVVALCVVAVVSFVALRSRPESDRNASQMSSKESRATEVSKENVGDAASVATGASNANTDGLLAQSNDNASRGSASANAAAQTRSGGGHGAAEAPPATATESKSDEPSPPPVEKPVDAAGEMARAATKSVSTEEDEALKAENKDKSPRKAENTDEIVSNDQPSQQKRGAVQPRGVEAQQQMPDGSRNQKRASENNISNITNGGGDVASSAPKAADRDSGAANRASASKRGRASAGATAGQREADDEDARADETRSAAGHRFRRVGGAWVDVNYKSSMSSTGVHRGTEPFSALVKEMPEIGRVAEQIGGEVIVVVHGRAYRIR
jgi:hypothetical protein